MTQTEQERGSVQGNIQGKTPAAALVEQSLQHPSAKKKKDFIESLRHRRLLCLDRAATYEELILELGGEIDEPMIDDMVNEGRNGSEEDEFAGFRGSQRTSRNQRRMSGNGNSQRDRTDGRGRVTSDEDRRLKGNETPELAAARHMEHGDDGRGEVRDPESDKRLKENESDALSRSRHQGGDGRGQVRSDDDGRLKENESDAMSRARHMETGKKGRKRDDE